MDRFATFAVAVIGAVGLCILSGCGGGSTASPTPAASVQIMLVDAPANRVQEVHVRLNAVEIARRADPVITLLAARDLPEDIDLISAGVNPIVLGTVDIRAGSYTYVRLGIDRDSPVNRVRTDDGTVHPLRVIGDPERNTTLFLPIRVVGGTEMTLLFDFAAAASVRETPDGWVLEPQVFTRYIERGVQFGTLRGVVREVDGEPLTVPPGQVLGVFLRTQEEAQTISLSEVCCTTGEFVVPQLVPGRYRLKVQRATPDWRPLGEPLIDEVAIRLGAGQTVFTEVAVDL